MQFFYIDLKFDNNFRFAEGAYFCVKPCFRRRSRCFDCTAFSLSIKLFWL